VSGAELNSELILSVNDSSILVGLDNWLEISEFFELYLILSELIGLK